MGKNVCIKRNCTSICNGATKIDCSNSKGQGGDRNDLLSLDTTTLDEESGEDKSNQDVNDINRSCGLDVIVIKEALKKSNSSNESTSTSSQECNVGKVDGIHQFITAEELNEKNGNNRDSDYNCQAKVEGCEIGGRGRLYQIIGAVCGIKINDRPSKDSSTESIDDLGDRTLCSAVQEENEGGSQSDS